MRPAVVVFAHDPSCEPKRFGLGAPADRALARCLFRRTLSVAASLGDCADVFLASDTPSAHAGLTFVRQRGEGFEARLLSALEDVAAKGYERLIVIGSDTPALGSGALREAVARGGTCAGPSSDGGFYLLAIDRCQISALRGLPWRRPGLLSALLRRLGGAHLFDPLSDLDRRDDLHRERRVLRALVRGERVLSRALGLPPAQAPEGEAPPPSVRARSTAPCRAPPAG